MHYGLAQLKTPEFDALAKFPKKTAAPYGIHGAAFALLIVRRFTRPAFSGPRHMTPSCHTSRPAMRKHRHMNEVRRVALALFSFSWAHRSCYSAFLPSKYLQTEHFSDLTPLNRISSSLLLAYINRWSQGCERPQRQLPVSVSKVIRHGAPLILVLGSCRPLAFRRCAIRGVGPM